MARKPKNVGLDSALDAVAQESARPTGIALDRAHDIGLRIADDRVQVQVSVESGRRNSVAEAIALSGGEVTGAGRNGGIIQAFVAPDALAALAASEGVLRVARPPVAHASEGDYLTEGDALLGGPAWRGDGTTGAGVKVGIIDVGFLGYEALLGTELPAAVTVANFVDGEGAEEVDETTEHGTACAEIVHDIAPDAEILLAKVDTMLDVEEAADWLIAADVGVISMSLGWHNVGPGDGTGWFEDIVANARAAGVTWFTAAGNSRQQHWGGASNLNSNGFHRFATGVTINMFTYANGDLLYLPSGYFFSVEASWSDWSAPVDQDFDVLLLRWNGSAWDLMFDLGTQLGGIDEQNGTPGQEPTEWAVGLSTGADTVYGFMVARWDSDTAVNFEMFADLPLAQRVASRSLDSTATAASVVAVGAIDDATLAHESYSSEGPTNGPGGVASGGAVKPDLAGYANVDTASYGADEFNGTSAATPHAAGAAALVLEANPSYTPDDLVGFLADRALDLGSTGRDIKFGEGRVNLGNPGTAPGAPTGVSATAGNGQATVSWSAPSEVGSSAITGYTVTSAPGAKTCTTDAATLSCTVSALTNGTPYTFTVVAANGAGDGPASLPSTAVTPTGPPLGNLKPDGRIRKGTGSYVGNNIYNLTGLNQSKTGAKARGYTIKFGISVQNDATSADSFRLTVSGAASVMYTVTYWRGTTNITAAVVAGTYTTPSLAPGTTYLITAKVKVNSSATAGSSTTRLVTITSVGDGTKQDAVGFTGKRL